MTRNLKRLGFAVVAVLVAGCGGSPAPAGPKADIVIPYIASVSGPAGPPGRPVEIPPADMAIAAINKAGGINGHKLSYQLLDDQNMTALAVQNYQQVKADALLIMGPIFGNPFSAVGPLANADKIPLVSGGSTVIDVARNNRPYVFMLNPDLVPVAQDIGKIFLNANPTVKRVVLIRDDTNVAPKNQGQYTADGLAKAGATVVGTVGYPFGTTDFAAIVSRAKSMSPDAIIVSSQPTDAVSIVQEIRRQGISAVLLGDPTDFVPQFVNNVGPAGVGMFVYTPYWTDDPKQSVQDFNQAYAAAASGLPANFTAAFVYESWLIVAAALRKAQIDGKSTADARLAILKALQTTSITGVSGETVKFNSSGFVDRSGVLLKIGADKKTTRVT